MDLYIVKDNQLQNVTYTKEKGPLLILISVHTENLNFGPYRVLDVPEDKPVIEMVQNRSSNPTLREAIPLLDSDLRIVLHTHVHPSPNSIIWYQSHGSDALRLGR